MDPIFLRRQACSILLPPANIYLWTSVLQLPCVRLVPSMTTWISSLVPCPICFWLPIVPIYTAMSTHHYCLLRLPRICSSSQEWACVRSIRDCPTHELCLRIQLPTTSRFVLGARRWLSCVRSLVWFPRTCWTIPIESDESIATSELRSHLLDWDDPLFPSWDHPRWSCSTTSLPKYHCFDRNDGTSSLTIVPMLWLDEGHIWNISRVR